MFAPGEWLDQHYAQRHQRINVCRRPIDSVAISLFGIFPSTLVRVDVAQAVSAARVASPQLEHTFVSFLGLRVLLPVASIITFVQQRVDAIVECRIRFRGSASGWFGNRFDGFGCVFLGFGILWSEDAATNVTADVLTEGRNTTRGRDQTSGD